MPTSKKKSPNDWKQRRLVWFFFVSQVTFLLALVVARNIHSFSNETGIVVYLSGTLLMLALLYLYDRDAAGRAISVMSRT